MNERQFLHEQAECCRRLARCVFDRRDVQALNDLAEEYEERSRRAPDRLSLRSKVTSH